MGIAWRRPSIASESFHNFHVEMLPATLIIPSLSEISEISSFAKNQVHSHRAMVRRKKLSRDVHHRAERQRIKDCEEKGS